MDDRKRIRELEDAMARMLAPLRGVPFSAIIKSLTGHNVYPIEPQNEADTLLVKTIAQAAHQVHHDLNKNPIIRPRPNEVGNDMETYVMQALSNAGLTCERPRNSKGNLQSSAYPDILVWDKLGNPIYIECKIYAAKSKNTTLRAFYLSPSKEPKVIQDAKHLLLAFETSSKPITNSANEAYFADAFTLVDLYGLSCNVKYEFNASNREIYKPELILAEERF